MATEQRKPRLAVLIDGDNVSSSVAPNLFNEIVKIGDATVHWVFGDFSGTKLKGWVKVSSTHPIVRKPTFPNTRGKNASDIALVIGAMDLLHTGRFDGFCLVSSDGDFTGLAQRIHGAGLDVYGFGEQKTPKSFQQACNKFVCLEKPVPKSPFAGQAGKSGKGTNKQLRAAVSKISEAIAELDNNGGWVRGSKLGKTLGLKFAHDYGHSTLGRLVEKLDAFEVRHAKTGAMEIRVKSPPRRKSSSAK